MLKDKFNECGKCLSEKDCPCAFLCCGLLVMLLSCSSEASFLALATVHGLSSVHGLAIVLPLQLFRQVLGVLVCVMPCVHFIRAVLL